jgi:hypothetical protein
LFSILLVPHVYKCRVSRLDGYEEEWYNAFNLEHHRGIMLPVIDRAEETGCHEEPAVTKT